MVGENEGTGGPPGGCRRGHGRGAQSRTSDGWKSSKVYICESYFSLVSRMSSFILFHFFSLQPREMRTNHNPAVRQHCVQPDNFAKPSGSQQAGAGGDGGTPVLSLGQGPVFPPPANLPMFCLCPRLHNPRGPSSTLPLSVFSSSGWLRGVDEQVWFPMAG